MKKFFCSEKGAISSFLLYIMLIVFVLLPLSAVIMEKYIVSVKASSIKDSIDISNIATYTAIVSEQAGKANIVVDNTKILLIFEDLLKKNLRLNDDLSPKDGSIAEGVVVIESINIYLSGFPVTCPDGTVIYSPAVCTKTRVPIRPSLYRETILNALGEEFIYLNLHVDSEIPVNN